LLTVSENCRRSKRLVDYLICLRRISSSDAGVRPIIIQSSAFSRLFVDRVSNNSLRVEILKLLAVVSDTESSSPLGLLSDPSILGFVMESIAGGDEKVVTATCFVLFLVAKNDAGRKLLFEQEIVPLFLTLVNGCSFRLMNYLMWVLCEIALTSDAGIMNQLIEHGFLDALLGSLPNLERTAVRVALDAVLRVHRLCEVTSQPQIAAMFFENEEIMDSLRDLSESEDADTAQCARSLLLLSQAQ